MKLYICVNSEIVIGWGRTPHETGKRAWANTRETALYCANANREEGHDEEEQPPHALAIQFLEEGVSMISVSFPPDFQRAGVRALFPCLGPEAWREIYTLLRLPPEEGGA